MKMMMVVMKLMILNDDVNGDDNDNGDGDVDVIN